MAAPWKEITQKEFEAMPPPAAPAKKASEYDEMLGVIDSDKVVSVQVSDEKKLKGTRIGLARRAATRGFKLEFRYDPDKMVLAVRKSASPYVPKAPSERTPRKSRKSGE